MKLFLKNIWKYTKQFSLIIIILFCFLSTKSRAQRTNIYTYGTPAEESASSLLNLNDGTYIIGAKNSTPDMLLMHVTNDGVILKQAIIQATHNITKLIKLSNGDYLIVGSETSAEQSATIMIRLNSAFNILWSRKLTATNLSYSFSVIECYNGDLMSVGYSSVTGTSNSDWDCLAYRLSSNGTLLWKNVLKTSANSDWLVDLVELPGGNVIAIGASLHTTVNYLMLKLSPSGVVLSKKYFDAGANEVMYSPIFLNNKLYITAGTWSFNIGQYDISFLRLDTNFVLEKSTVFGGTGIDFPMHSIIKNNELNIVAYSNSIDVNYDFFLFTLDLDGTLKKSKRIGGTGRELLFTKGNLFVINDNNTYTITGETNTYGKGLTDIFLATFDINYNCCDFFTDIVSGLSSVNGVYTSNNTFSISENSTLNTFSNITKTINSAITLAPDSNCVFTPFNLSIAADTSVCVNEVVSFSLNTNGTNLTYSWDFGDPGSGANNTSTISTPNHSFSTPGYYEVIIAANDGCVIKNDTIRIRVIQQGNTNTSISNMYLTYCRNQPVPFSALNSQVGVNYSWNFDDINSGSLNTSNNQNTSHSFTDTGLFTITLISNFQCLSDTDTISIYIITDDSLIANIDTNITLGCNNNIVNFENLTQGTATLFYWIFGDPSSGVNNFSTIANPTHIYIQPGTYTVTLIVGNNCYRDTIRFEVLIPVISPVITSINNLPKEYCINELININYTTNQLNVKAYWDFGDGSVDSSNSNSISHTYSSAGNYLITLITKNNCHSDTDTINIIIKDKALAAIITNSTTYCSGENIQFNSTITGEFTNLKWNFDDPTSGTNNTSTLPNPNHIYTNSGNYTISLIVESACGIDTATLLIIIKQKINLDTQIPGLPRNYCKGDSIKISAISQDPNALYNWDFGDPASGLNNFANGQNVAHIFNNYGNYIIKLTSSNECDLKTDTIHIRIIEPSKPDFAIDIDSCLKIINLENLSIDIDNNNFTWMLNDSIVSIEKNTSSMLNYEGVHKISLIVNPNTNCEDSIVKIISFTMPPLDSKLDIPNTFSPNNDGINDFFLIKGTSNCEIKKMIVFNRWGKKLYESDESFIWDGKIETANCPVGTYILYLEIGSNTIVKTINLLR